MFLDGFEQGKADFIVILGDGSFDKKVLMGIARKLDGKNISLGIPSIIFQRKTGLRAIDALKTYIGKSRISSYIFMTDRDVFKYNPINEIHSYLNSIGIEVINWHLIKEAYLHECRLGNNAFKLYSIIAGSTTFIEEEIAKLLELSLGEKINLNGERDNSWKNRIKSEVKQILRQKGIKIDKFIINNVNKSILERAFPNIYAVMKHIEKIHVS